MIVKGPGDHFSLPPLLSGLDHYFANVMVDCPYGQPCQAVYHQAILGRLDDRTMNEFLAAGYRRNGNCMYNMHCPECHLCVPIRIRPSDFQPNRNQRRVWKKNQDVIVEIAPLTMSPASLDLLQRFLSTRFPDGQSSAESYYAGFFITSISNCFELRYKVQGKVFGVCIVDGSADWFNAVYFFFDPNQGWRSPGTLNILTLNNLCLRHNIKMLYLGYWIDGQVGMDYKSRFRPHELLLDGQWQVQK